MAEPIAIPSPSVFLRPDSPPPPAPSAQQRPAKSTKHDRKPSTGQAKKTPRKGAATAANGDPSVGKPKQTKSRNGCVTCKIKRLKCDEEKPGCKQCARRKVECGGYRKEYKWCPFEETNVKQLVERQKQSSPPRQSSGDSSKVNSPADEQALQAVAAVAPTSGAEVSVPAPGTPLELPQRPAPSPRTATWPTFTGKDKSKPSKPDEPSTKHSGTTEDIPSQPLEPEEQELVDDAITTINHTSRGPSPTLTEILMPFTDGLNDVTGLMGGANFEDLQMLPMPQFPETQPLFHRADNNNALHDISFHNGRSAEQVQQLWASRYSSPTNSSSTAMSDEQQMGLWRVPTTYLYNQPGMQQGSPEALANRFMSLTCGILSIMDGPTENPWRSLIWPLAMDSNALYHAVIAMTAYQSCGDIKELRNVALYHEDQSIKEVREGLQNNSFMSNDAAIATALALGFTESWKLHTASGNTHIKGAQVLVRREIARHQRNPRQGTELARLKFLCNAWVYMDVIARLTSVDSDDSEEFDNTLLFAPDGPETVMGEPGFGINFGMPVDARLDPLMGCANTLFPLIGRVANLVRRVCRTQKNSPGIIEQANELKLLLETWEPPEFIERPEDPTTQLDHALQTAEAYRWATLLHLQQSVPELPSSLDEELAREVMNRLATVPTVSRMVIVQIYPLMVAGCLADTPEDRAWVSKRWGAMSQRMRIGVIEKCAVVTKEVWRRRDKYKSTPQDQRMIIRTSELHPIRRKGAPLKRTRDEPDEDPGQSGVVFSWIQNENSGNGTGSRPQSSGGSGRRRPGSSLEAYAPFSVRGHIHWVGVMWDWGWEILLG